MKKRKELVHECPMLDLIKMRASFLGLFFISVVTGCSQQSKPDKIYKITDSENLILGIWTDGSGPSASIQIGNDSVYNVEYLESSKYTLTGDSLRIYYTDGIFRAKIKRLDADSLIYVSEYGETKMWRFSD